MFTVVFREYVGTNHKRVVAERFLLIRLPQLSAYKSRSQRKGGPLVSYSARWRNFRVKRSTPIAKARVELSQYPCRSIASDHRPPALYQSIMRVPPINQPRFIRSALGSINELIFHHPTQLYRPTAAPETWINSLVSDFSIIFGNNGRDRYPRRQVRGSTRWIFLSRSPSPT